jgi:hypothetical protein
LAVISAYVNIKLYGKREENDPKFRYSGLLLTYSVGPLSGGVVPGGGI